MASTDPTQPSEPTKPTKPTKPALIPSRYVGAHVVRLARQHGPVLTPDKAHREGTLLRPGDVLLLPETEVRGQTYLIDPHREREALYLGVGRVTLPEHAALSDDELSALGYEFHQGRADFEPVEPTGPAVDAVPTTTEKAKQATPLERRTQ